MVVDHEDMRMFDATMAMGMPMRFVALGSVMAVIVVLVVDVFVFVIEFIVHMRQRFVVSRRPQPRRYEGEEKDIRRQNQCRHLNADSRPEVARHRIQYEPARMGQGELGRKVGWTIPGRCRTIDESPRWRLHGRPPCTHEEPRRQQCHETRPHAHPDQARSHQNGAAQHDRSIGAFVE